jgi:hypothetical protein
MFDHQWYLDEDPVTVTFSLDSFFSCFNPIWDQLLEGLPVYMGKVNAYDVGNMIQKAVMECNRGLAEVLRFLLQDIEENKNFANIPKEDIWKIRWGMYRNESELIAYVDRIPKDQEKWERAIADVERNPESLVFSYWYQTELKKSDCSQKPMSFITFEECRLEGITFDQANLSGARFLRCELIGCSFLSSICRQAEFTDCVWENNQFANADLGGAVFTEEDLLHSGLSKEQIETVMVEVTKERSDLQ